MKTKGSVYNLNLDFRAKYVGKAWALYTGQ